MVVLQAVEAAACARAALFTEISVPRFKVCNFQSRGYKARSGSRKASAGTRELEVFKDGTSVATRHNGRTLLGSLEKFRQVGKRRSLISKASSVNEAVEVTEVPRPQAENGTAYRGDHLPHEVLELEREYFDDGDSSDESLQIDSLACDGLKMLPDVCAVNAFRRASADGHDLAFDQDMSVHPDGSSIVLRTPLSMAVIEEAFPRAKHGLNGHVTTKDLVHEAPVVHQNEENIYVEVPGNCSFWQAMMNSVNILLGVGLLSIPYAMSQGGWSALGVLALLGIATNYTGKILGTCQSSICLARGPAAAGVLERGLRTYEDIGEAAFGEVGRQLITGVLYTELVGTCGLFFILEGDNLATLFGGDPKTYMLASALVLLPTTWLPDLSALAGLGALGAMASVSVLGVLMYSFVHGGFPEGPGTALLHLHTLPLTFGLLAFVYAGHAVFPNIQASMKNPEEYPKMLDFTYITVGLVCALVGSVGYRMFGSNAMEEITLNLPAGHLATIATSLIIINPFTKFALTMEPVAQGLEGLLGLQRLRDPLPATSGGSAISGGLQETSSKAPSAYGAARILGRTALGGLALFLATSVPFFGGVMALVGSCLTLGVSVIFPSAAYLSLFGGQMSSWEKAWNYFVVSLGVFCAAAGTLSALESLQNGTGSHLL